MGTKMTFLTVMVCLLTALLVPDKVYPQKTNKQFDFLLSQIKILKEQVSKNTKTIKDLQAENEIMHNLNRKYIKTMEDMQEENAQLTAKLYYNTKKMQAKFIGNDQKTTATKYSKSYNSNSQAHNQSETKNSKTDKQVSLQNFVAFSAFPTIDRTFSDGDRILFDEVITNVGDYYDKAQSIFVCPVNAYYMFTVTARAMNQYLHATIYLESQPLVAAFSELQEDYDQGTNTVVIMCGSGQEVAVYCTGTDSGMLAGEYRDSVFTGILLSLV